jgi:hypothetical protein
VAWSAWMAAQVAHARMTGGSHPSQDRIAWPQ